MFIFKNFFPTCGKLSKIVCPWVLVSRCVYTDLAFLISLVGIKHIPNKNAALIPNNNVTLHAMINKECCCREGYNSCYTELEPESLSYVSKDDDCNNDLDDVWNAWFDILINSIPIDGVHVNLTIKPISSEGGPSYHLYNITIQLQGTLCTFVLLLDCVAHSNLHVYTSQQIGAVPLRNNSTCFEPDVYMYNVRASGEAVRLTDF